MALVGFFGLFASFSNVGCANEKFRQGSARRENRIRTTVADVGDRETERQRRLEHVQRFHQARRRVHAEHLERTSTFVDQRYAARSGRWHLGSPRRHESVRRVLRGKPETIGDTWADMTY
jgi:hypothetical protein